MAKKRHFVIHRNMYFRFFLNSLLIICLTAIQISFIPSLPFQINHFNLILVILIFILNLYGLRTALWWSAGAGLLLDIFSFSFFGIFLISLSASVVFVYFLLKNFFTNRSLYSFLVLTVVFTIFYEMILGFLNYFISIFLTAANLSFLTMVFWQDLFYQLVFNLATVIMIFYFVNFFSNKLKPAFLLKSAK